MVRVFLVLVKVIAFCNYVKFIYERCQLPTFKEIRRGYDNTAFLEN